jgi:hypothetical protein
MWQNSRKTMEQDMIFSICGIVASVCMIEQGTSRPTGAEAFALSGRYLGM